MGTLDQQIESQGVRWGPFCFRTSPISGEAVACRSPGGPDRRDLVNLASQTICRTAPLGHSCKHIATPVPPTTPPPAAPPSIPAGPPGEPAAAPPPIAASACPISSLQSGGAVGAVAAMEVSLELKRNAALSDAVADPAVTSTKAPTAPTVATVRQTRPRMGIFMLVMDDPSSGARICGVWLHFFRTQF